jgi:deazaflavin-dependent oxidoreductase (nitroreductase family)
VASGWLARRSNEWQWSRVRKSGGRGMMGMNLLGLTTIGARSGEERHAAVAWFPADDGGWLISASARGAAGNPAWYHNLAAHPDKVRIDVDGETHDVTAEQLHGEVRARAWEQIVAAAPRFGDYTTKTDREIPVIHLRPKAV